ncbi:MAG: hypothetical protein EOO46_22050 [Flavobacterium sp.]|nr:MAG: hypothetical protein EOO46_22050 [Flavobacterium sp.]
MKFWNKKEKATENQRTATKTDVLHGLHLRSAYFENNIPNHELFRPEFEISEKINSILEKKDALTKSDVDDILNLLNDFEKIEHYDGSGWYDYQIQLAYFLRLSGFDTEVKNRKPLAANR